MNIFSAFAIIIVAGLIHASFQLSISILTLLSSHTIGRKKSHMRLLALTHSFVFGASTMTILLLCFFALLLQSAFASAIPSAVVWTIVCGAMVGLAFAVFLFYYRRQTGTVLWVPRGMARYLSTRAKTTKHSAEAFSLGLSSVAAEILFIGAPITVAALILIQLPPLLQLAGVLTYGVVATSSLAVIHILISGGHSISRLQKWREQNKHFLQFAAGGGLLVLGFYLYVDQVMTVAVMAAEKIVW